MTNKLDCQQITISLQTINSKRDDLLVLLEENNIGDCIDLRDEISALIDEIVKKFWSLEKLSLSEIQKQYSEWEEAYVKLDLGLKFPSEKRIIDFLKSDSGFMELMKTKERQGLTRMIIAPAPGSCLLAELINRIDQEIIALGGERDYYSETWQDVLNLEKYFKYFGKFNDSLLIDQNVPLMAGGATPGEIREDPEKYGICDGWMISFTTSERNIVKYTESDIDTGEGRMAIKTDMTAVQYFTRYFSGKDKTYAGEESMIPQEYFSLFYKDIYEKYIKNNKSLKVDGFSNDLFGSDSVTIFQSCYLPGTSELPMVRWYEENHQLGLLSNHPAISLRNGGVRSVVRRNSKK